MINKTILNRIKKFLREAKSGDYIQFNNIRLSAKDRAAIIRMLDTKFLYRSDTHSFRILKSNV